MGQSDDSWNFKLEGDKDKQKKKKEAIAKEKKKRLKEKSSLSQTDQTFKMEAPPVAKRKSRSELAKEYEREEDKVVEPLPDEEYGSFVRRGVALAIDFAVCFGVLFFVLTYHADTWIQLELALFGTSDYGYGPLLTYFSSLAFVCYFVFSVFPTILFGKSVGKTFVGVKVYGKGIEPLGYLKTFMREILFRPLSLISILGALICYLSPQRKMLHDHLVGSVVRRF